MATASKHWIKMNRLLEIAGSEYSPSTKHKVPRHYDAAEA